ncbi:uncharacterized protein LOC129953448 [Eupeodes corollae]|uniref:uncharacterized protein LOC129953448 n=1 Tax=Eupeodes corollae TaxID=290404 RepID=UPI002493CABF|nr:uncharacterized protein LOC129953448 [Eupeodes corollae]
MANFVYLKSFLTANVTSSIAHLDVTGETYDEALEDLKDRYSNDQVLFNAFMKKFMNLPTYTQPESAAQLKSFHDSARACIFQLRNLKFHTDENSEFFAFHLLEKLSPATRLEFEKHRKEPKKVAKLQQLLDFLKSTFLIADAAHATSNSESRSSSLHQKSNNSSNKSQGRKEIGNFHVSKKSIVCPIERCKGPHVLRKCQQFLQWSPFEPPFPNPNKASTSSQLNHAPTVNPQIVSNNLVHSNSTVLRATAIVNVLDASGQLIRLRALVDKGSQQSIITERAAQRLKLTFIPFCIGYRPMGEIQYKIGDKGLSLNIHSIVNPKVNFTSKFAVLPSITSELPLHSVKVKSWHHLDNLPLADPYYATPGQIDLLLGGDVYGRIIEEGLRKGEFGEPVAQYTTLGWILFGELFQANHVLTFPLIDCHHISTMEIGEYLTKFHELEEVPTEKTMSKEDEWTEKFYEETTTRQSNGKFMELNQVKLVHEIDEKHFYLPHHAVVKEASLTTKLRQVFDGSAKSTNGKSLNDILTTGPVLQADLVSIILNWRTHKYVFIADIQKMYRCIDIHPDDTHYQYVLWQDNDNLGIQTYALQTVTFGLASSPYQAIKTIHMVAEKIKAISLTVYIAFKLETYVDDITTGSETIENAIEMIQIIIHLLRSAGFELRKWASNSPEILQQIPIEYHDQNTMCLFNVEDAIKTVGLGWSSIKDLFTFCVNFPTNKQLTKRNVSSTVARLFDPLGWLNPFVTKEKLFLNKLWESKFDWDDIITSIDLKSVWEKTFDQLQFIKEIEIPRWINTSSTNKNNELHVFCDSSNRAYATSIYLRTIDSNEKIHVNLIMAKSKLTPMRKPLTTPRAELCGAVLAVKLLELVKKSLRIQFNNVFMWTDSSVVLSWIRGDPNRWSVFVCNRIHKILSSTKIGQWHHVRTFENPADLNSRGLTIIELRDSSLWWHGPQFLSLPQSDWPDSPFEVHDDDRNELRSKVKSINLNIKEEVSSVNTLMQRFFKFQPSSSCTGIRHSFRENCSLFKLKLPRPSKSMLSIPRKELIELVPTLTVDEIQNSELSLIRWIQSNEFSCELKTIQDQNPIKKSSKLYRLNPFIDNNNILRVNGRLQNAFTYVI